MSSTSLETPRGYTTTDTRLKQDQLNRRCDQMHPAHRMLSGHCNASDRDGVRQAQDAITCLNGNLDGDLWCARKRDAQMALRLLLDRRLSSH
ncbi:hypothetical protein IRJ41_001208 [Triplophysa rosa]|uniref:Uncharacterized protein n=1 Tax=Triplophysa rosa TaxID=992332 RepID=A0A9W7WC58_TRIRA|nr:hypothetical protein IRJ41_001208 [Triplophysa rosa]